MKAYKVEILIIDHDELAEEEIISNIENVNYPNDCIIPRVMYVEKTDIGEWDDDHPLNNSDTVTDEYDRIFGI